MKVGCFILATVVLAVAIAVPLGDDADGARMDGLMLYQVNPYGCEGVSVHNYGSATVDMKDYTIADSRDPSKEGWISFASIKVPSGSTLIIASNYTPSDAFVNQTGVSVVYYKGDRDGSDATMTGSFNLSNSGDDVYLLKGSAVIDAVCYGNGKIGDGSVWTGPTASKNNNGWIQRTGSEDTNTYSDWRIVIPGQTTFDFDPSLRFDATVTPFTFPESGGVPVYKAISDATESIRIEIYMLQSRNIMGLLAEKAEQGLDVDILMEGNPLGYKDSVTNAAPYYRYLVDKGAEIRFINVGDIDRYSYDHAKFAVIDNDTTIVTSENWVTDNMNGTIRDTSYKIDGNGNRGWGAIIESAGYAGFMSDVFANDWSMDYGDVKTFSELYPSSRSSEPTYNQPPSWGSFKPYAAKVTPVLSNDSSYAAFEYYASNAKERLYCEQQSLKYQGTVDLLSAASDRGVDVKLLVGSNATNDPDASAMEINSKTGIQAAVMTKPYVHNKGVIADDTVWVSSINWTSNSFFNNRECCAAIHSPEVADYFASYFAKDFQQYYSYDGFRAFISELETEYEAGAEITIGVTVNPDGAYTYVWDLGDGSAVRTTDIGRIVATPEVGTHTLTVKVSDADGNTVTLTQDYTVKDGIDILGELEDHMYLMALVLLVLIAVASAVLKPKKSGRSGSRGRGKNSSGGRRRRSRPRPAKHFPKHLHTPCPSITVLMMSTIR